MKTKKEMKISKASIVFYVASVIFLAIAFSIVMLAVDIMYAFIDPRIKGQYQSKKRGK